MNCHEPNCNQKAEYINTDDLPWTFYSCFEHIDSDDIDFELMEKFENHNPVLKD